MSSQEVLKVILGLKRQIFCLPTLGVICSTGKLSPMELTYAGVMLLHVQQSTATVALVTAPGIFAFAL